LPAFTEVDKDENGIVDRGEFADALGTVVDRQKQEHREKARKTAQVHHNLSSAAPELVEKSPKRRMHADVLNQVNRRYDASPSRPLPSRASLTPPREHPASLPSFAEADRNQDGFIDKSEFCAAWEDSLGQENARATMQVHEVDLPAFTEVDKDENGIVDRGEFADAFASAVAKRRTQNGQSYQKDERHYSRPKPELLTRSDFGNGAQARQNDSGEGQLCSASSDRLSPLKQYQQQRQKIADVSRRPIKDRANSTAQGVGSMVEMAQIRQKANGEKTVAEKEFPVQCIQGRLFSSVVCGGRVIGCVVHGNTGASGALGQGSSIKFLLTLPIISHKVLELLGKLADAEVHGNMERLGNCSRIAGGAWQRHLAEPEQQWLSACAHALDSLAVLLQLCGVNEVRVAMVQCGFRELTELNIEMCVSKLEMCLSRRFQRSS